MSAFYAGSWQPLHFGHLAIANWYERKYGKTVTFVLSRKNVDKPTLQSDEIVKRRSQFVNIGRKLKIVEGPTFIAMVQEINKELRLRMLRNGGNSGHDLTQTHLVGVDTLRRINDPKYTFGSETERDRVVRVLADKCRFIVFPRHGESLSDLHISSRLRDVCTHAYDFENSNISSTVLRLQEEFSKQTTGAALKIGDEFVKKIEQKPTIYKTVQSNTAGIVAQYHEEFFEIQPNEVLYLRAATT